MCYYETFRLTNKLIDLNKTAEMFSIKLSCRAYDSELTDIKVWRRVAQWLERPHAEG